MDKSLPLCLSNELTTALAHALIVSPWSKVKLKKLGEPTKRLQCIWRRVGPARKVTLSSKKVGPARWVTLQDKQFAKLVRKYRKRWLTRGSLGRQVTLLPGTSFLAIKKCGKCFLKNI